jgi:hypothetical protein
MEASEKSKTSYRTASRKKADGAIISLAGIGLDGDEDEPKLLVLPLDARMFTGAAVIAAPIKKVIDEMKRFEKQPNRREPWTLQLQSRLFRETDDKPADSLAKAGCQWYCCVFPAGCRRIKWWQPYANRDPSKAPDQNDWKDTYAFCVDDVQFLGIGQFRLTTPRTISHRKEVYYVELTFRMQKNGKHGEVKRYSRNTRTPSLDAVANWIVILKRFDRLAGLDNKQ